MKNLVVMGVDPGLTGAIALYDVQRGTLTIDDMPVTRVKGKMVMDLPGFGRLVAHNAGFCDVCVVELVGSMPVQGVASAFKFGYCAGAIDGILSALDVPVVKLTPAVWKSRVGLPAGGTHKDRKALSRAAAARLFPDYAGLFARAKDDGRAEAALIAWAHNTSGAVH